MTIRGLPEEVRGLLRLRVAKAGRSTEAEVRAILVEAKIPAYTADGAWLSLDTGIRVKTIR